MSIKEKIKKFFKKESDMVKIGNRYYSKKFLKNGELWRITNCYRAPWNEYVFELGNTTIPLFEDEVESKAEYEKAVKIILDLRK